MFIRYGLCSLILAGCLCVGAHAAQPTAPRQDSDLEKVRIADLAAACQQLQDAKNSHRTAITATAITVGIVVAALAGYWLKRRFLLGEEVGGFSRDGEDDLAENIGDDLAVFGDSEAIKTFVETMD
ncbi:MAG: hypothetical protein WCW33_01090 [Candidatus Babeliales bacterium]|jgi:hypothetical protein